MSASDAFFYWGKMDLKTEIQEDILTGCLQGRRSLFYNRAYGAGVSEFENQPISLVTLVTMRLEVQKFFSARNNAVTVGQTFKGISYPDRRAATSQTLVNVTDEGGGNLYVDVPFVLLSDLTRTQKISAPLGVG